MPRFSPAALLERLREFSDTRCYWVAFSGGLDSQVLLHGLHASLSQLGTEIKAVHVNHGLSPNADEWSQFCQQVCRDLAIPCEVIRIDARAPPGQSPEAWARQLRYEAMARLLKEGDVLLTGHHQDDQAETLLLQLFRGAGPEGLAAMPRWARFGPGWLGRPLLDFSRSDLTAYAEAQGLRWVEDQSNLDRRFDRNFLRHMIVPLLKQRWPSVSRTLARAARWQAEAVRIMDMMAEQDLHGLCLKQNGALSVKTLKQLDNPRRHNVLRVWLKAAHLPLPSARHLERLSEDVLNAAWDATPCLAWPGVEIRRYRDLIYAMKPLAPHHPGAVLRWDLCTPLKLSSGALRAERVTGAGLKAALCNGKTVTVRFRRGGERCRPVGRPHTHTLKHLLQEAGIPPWQRDRIPLIYLDGDLAAVAGLWVCHPFGAGLEDEGWRLVWMEHGR